MQKSVYLMDLDTMDLKYVQTAMVKILHDFEDPAYYYALCGLDIARSSGEGLGRGLKTQRQSLDNLRWHSGRVIGSLLRKALTLGMLIVPGIKL